MITILAEASASGDPMISGNWIIAVIGALASAIALFYGKRVGLKEATNNVTLQNPFPEVPVRKVDRPVSFDQHSALDARVARIEIHLDQIQRDQASQYRQILEAGSERELRLTETLNKGLRDVHERLDGLIKSTPHTRRS
jgi:hypothetical protein